MGTPKGRKAKKTTFNFTGRKLDMNISPVQAVTDQHAHSSVIDDVNDTTMQPIVPSGSTCKLSDDKLSEEPNIDFNVSHFTGLKNICYDENGKEYCANICFFNSIFQILRSIPSYRCYIMKTTIDNIVVRNIRQLFEQIDSSAECVNPYNCVTNLGMTLV